MKRYLLLLVLVVVAMCASTTDVAAQTRLKRVYGASAARWGKEQNGDSVLYITLLPVKIKGGIDLAQHQRMVRAVKKVYPLAIEAAERLEELDRELEKLNLKKDRKAYTKAVEDALKEEITPMLWKMTRYEGKILIKLIDRETDHTVFSIVKDIRSGFTAGFYQAMARLFGANLKLEYDPEGEDYILEQIVIYYNAGLL
jgi:opacity protein-like surface antigen